MNPICTNCPGALTGDCVDCNENEDPRGGDYDEDEFDEERPDDELDGERPEDFGPEEDKGGAK